MGKLLSKTEKIKLVEIEDKWILSKLNSLIKKVTQELEELHPHLASRSLQEFWLNELSRGYIQLVRDRLASDNEVVKYVLNEVYLNLIKLCAPFLPFITEKIWQELRNKKIVEEESIHLTNWPFFDAKKINGKLEEDFIIAMKIIEKGMAERDNEKIGLRWPLAKAHVEAQHIINDSIKKIIEKQLNVKNVEIRKSNSPEIIVKLHTVTTPELEAEGFSRELARKIQDQRKQMGLIKGDLIEVKIYCDDNLKNMFLSNLEFLKERTNSKKIDFSGGGSKKAIIATIKNKNIGVELLK